MKEQFVTYEIALAMKELGFNEECLGYYFVHIKDAPVELIIEINTRTNANFIKAGAKRCCLAPLWQQCIDWFYSEKSIIIEVHSSYEFTDRSVITYHIIINNKYGLRFISKQEFNYNSLYEAREQAVLKTIELCRN